MLIQSTEVPASFLPFRKELPIADSLPLTFLDIETMGLSRKRDPIILIGMMQLDSESGFLHQYFSENTEDEKEMLWTFVRSIPENGPLITYNGRAFDIPYINHRLAVHGIPYTIPAGRGIDLMYWAKKALPDAPRYTLKAVEICMGIHRADTLSGAQCVQQYTTYLKTREPHLAADICRHNYEDILHMAPLLKLFAQLPEQSSLRVLPFQIPLPHGNFWMEVPVYKNGFLLIQGSSEQNASRDTVNYTGSASLRILKGKLEATLPVIEFAYPEPESLFIDPDHIPGLMPAPFNALPLHEKTTLLIRNGCHYLPDAVAHNLKRLLALNI